MSDEFVWGWGGTTSGRKGQLSRKLKVTSCTVTVTHVATGEKLSGDIPPGHYSKKDMRARRERLAEALIERLRQDLRTGERKKS